MKGGPSVSKEERQEKLPIFLPGKTMQIEKPAGKKIEIFDKTELDGGLDGWKWDFTRSKVQVCSGESYGSLGPKREFKRLFQGVPDSQNHAPKPQPSEYQPIKKEP